MPDYNKLHRQGADAVQNRLDDAELGEQVHKDDGLGPGRGSANGAGEKPNCPKNASLMFV